MLVRKETGISIVRFEANPKALLGLQDRPTPLSLAVQSLSQLL
jgi:hypothetical protein